MKKRATKRSPGDRQGKKAGGHAPTEEVGHLDQTITRLASSASTGAKRHWKGIVILIVVVAVAVIGFQVQSAISDSRAENIHRRLFELTKTRLPTIVEDEETVPDVEAILQLVQDVEGHPSEKVVLKTTAEFLLEKAESFAEQAREEKEAGPENEDTSTATGAEENDPRDVADSLFAAVQKIVERGERRFPEDTKDIGPWAASTMARIRSDENRDWLPPPRSYRLQVPSETEAADETEAAAAATPPAGESTVPSGEATEATPDAADSPVADDPSGEES